MFVSFSAGIQSQRAVIRTQFRFAIVSAVLAESGANMKTKVIVAIMAASLTACTTGEKISQIRPGMTTAQVTAILGHPDGFRQVGDTSYYQYSNRLTSGWG